MMRVSSSPFFLQHYIAFSHDTGIVDCKSEDRFLFCKKVRSMKRERADFENRNNTAKEITRYIG